jgi:hypothetical protein
MLLARIGTQRAMQETELGCRHSFRLCYLSGCSKKESPFA